MKIASLLDLREKIKNKRYIVVGDIHGLYVEFQELLNRIRFDFNKDVIVSVGDLVDRGPHSTLILDWFINNNQYSVLGNHDEKFMRYLKGNPIKISNGLQKTIDELNSFSEDFRQIRTKIYFDWLQTRPHIIRLPDFKNQRQFVVHGGFDLTRSIELQEINDCLRKRNISDLSNDRWYINYTGTDRIYFGHQIHENWNPHTNIFALDNGPLKSGKLRALINGTELVEIATLKDYLEFDDE